MATTTVSAVGVPLDLPNFVVIDDLIVDAFVSEEHSFEAEVTNYPVESGSSISDNYRIKPMTITVEGIISSTPLAPVAGQRDDPAHAPGEAYSQLLLIRNQKKTVTVTTSLNSYANMMLVDLNIPRGPGGASYLHFTAKFQQVNFVSVAKAQPSIPTASAQKKVTRALGSVPGTATYNIIKIDASGNPDAGDVLWYDKNIDGWRWSGHYSQALQKWLFFRGLPYGFESADGTIAPDTAIKKVIDANPSDFDPIAALNGGPSAVGIFNTEHLRGWAANHLIATASGVVTGDEGYFHADALASSFRSGSTTP